MAGGVEVSPDGKVWVTDQGNGRRAPLPRQQQGRRPGARAGELHHRHARCATECNVTGSNTGSRLASRRRSATTPPTTRSTSSTGRAAACSTATTPSTACSSTSRRSMNGMAATEIITRHLPQHLGRPGPVDLLDDRQRDVRVAARPASSWSPASATPSGWRTPAPPACSTSTSRTGSWKQRKVISQSNLSDYGDNGVNCPSWQQRRLPRPTSGRHHRHRLGGQHLRRRDAATRASCASAQRQHSGRARHGRHGGGVERAAVPDEPGAVRRPPTTTSSRARDSSPVARRPDGELPERRQADAGAGRLPRGVLEQLRPGVGGQRRVGGRRHLSARPVLELGHQPGA